MLGKLAILHIHRDSVLRSEYYPRINLEILSYANRTYTMLIQSRDPSYDTSVLGRVHNYYSKYEWEFFYFLSFIYIPVYKSNG